MGGSELAEVFIASKHVYSNKHNNKVRGKRLKCPPFGKADLSSYRQSEQGEIRPKAEKSTGM